MPPTLNNHLCTVDSVLVSDGDNASDADSDLEELRGDIVKFDESVRQFLSSHQSREELEPHSRGVQKSRGPRGPRGPRKAAKPRGDITARLSKVNQAFLSRDYAKALDLVSEVIRINAETHQAWTALSSIFREQGENGRALSAMVYAAHLRPKDLSGWLACASFALNTMQSNEASNLHTARLCYSAALKADPTNLEARLGKAAVCHQQGHVAAAISEYNHALKKRPRDIDIVRKLAEACIDNKNVNSAVQSAIVAYRQYFEYEMEEMRWHRPDTLWHDIGIYVELFASAGQYQKAIFELKALSRWLTGREEERFWAQWNIDDCEWDIEDNRRFSVPGFSPQEYDTNSYGLALPLDLRARLAIYRLRIGEETEALRHLESLDPDYQQTSSFAADFPFLAFDLADELSTCGRPCMASKYFELLRQLPGDPDANILLHLGRCYIATGEQSLAEECFHAVIDADEDNIEARIQLANMYEKAKEDEEALILAAEAITLREAQAHPSGISEGVEQFATSMSSLKATNGSKMSQIPRGHSTQLSSRPGRGSNSHILPRRYRAKRLANPDQRLQDEQSHAIKLSQKYDIVHGLKEQIKNGRHDLVPTWMAASKELVDDFRSLKRFYTWEKYLNFIGRKRSLEPQTYDQPDSQLSEMYERLTRSLAPPTEIFSAHQSSHISNAHQGITFDNWLELFLDFAISLALTHRREEAYQVCESARDSTAFQSPEQGYVIHVAWSVCAIYTNDEEKCVGIARYLMKDGGLSDSYRMFALLSVLCQSPVSWYTSGPAQKYILRQIKHMDAEHAFSRVRYDSNIRHEPGRTHHTSLNVDICLLMLYGHILFTSTSYTYALGYFLRARSIDPQNPMVNLSLGLAYVHYGLKRQSTNRQYLLLQGQAFVMQYAEPGKEGLGQAMAERYYNVGRLFQLLGIEYLGLEYYTRALEENASEDNNPDLKSNIINNIISILSINNKDIALQLIKNNLKL